PRSTLFPYTTLFRSLLAVLFSTAISGQEAAGGGGAPADLVYTRPGQLVDVGGFRLNLYCIGSGSPTVVFDSGWGDWAPAWSKVQDRKSTRLNSRHSQ